MRLFVAVPLPAGATERVSGVQERARKACTQARWKVSWVSPGNLHLTLKFLGHVHDERLPEIEQALAALGEHAPFQMHLSGLGSFPAARRPRVVWLGVDEGARELHALSEALEAGFEALGFAREKRPFRAHLTLGRVKEATGSGLQVLEALRDVDVGTYSVDGVVLFRSHLKRAGAVYEPIVRIPLGGREASEPGSQT